LACVSEAPDDPDAEADQPIWVKKARWRGAFREEYAVRSDLWLLGARREQLRRWIGEVFPGPLALLRRGRKDDVYFGGEQLIGYVAGDEERLRVQLSTFDGGFLHAVAQRAAADGVSSLAVVGESFYGPAPYLALAEYTPGAAPRTEWLDPLRGLSPGDVARDWLPRYVGVAAAVEAWALDQVPQPPLPPVARFATHLGGRLLPAVRWFDEEPADGPAAPTSNLEFVKSAEALYASPWPARVEATTALWSVFMFAVLTVLALALPLLGAAMVKPRAADDVALLCAMCTACVGWLAFVPLEWPTGRPIPLGARLVWFGAGPSVVVVGSVLLGGA
jgi:hypothetical protein